MARSGIGSFFVILCNLRPKLLSKKVGRFVLYSPFDELVNASNVFDDATIKLIVAVEFN
jgi:hypothetical protein